MSGAGASITADEKGFKTLCAAAAMRGIELLRTDPADGVQRLLAVRGRQAVLVTNTDDLEALWVGAARALTT